MEKTTCLRYSSCWDDEKGDECVCVRLKKQGKTNEDVVRTYVGKRKGQHIIQYDGGKEGKSIVTFSLSPPPNFIKLK